MAISVQFMLLMQKEEKYKDLGIRRICKTEMMKKVSSFFFNVYVCVASFGISSGTLCDYETFLENALNLEIWKSVNFLEINLFSVCTIPTGLVSICHSEVEMVETVP